MASQGLSFLIPSGAHASACAPERCSGPLDAVRRISCDWDGYGPAGVSVRRKNTAVASAARVTCGSES